MISVIMPVYNEATHINRAIQSCLIQAEVTSIIIVDDGSTDNTPSLIKKISDPRITLLTHPDGVRLGRSASRNLGFRHAQTEWIAFCDGDDYYLPDRFTHLNLTNTFIDGYYDVIASDYAPGVDHTSVAPQTGITEDIDSDHLGDYLISQREARISILGLVARKSAMLETGLFDTDLVMGEDTDLIWRLSLSHRLTQGRSDYRPIATRWVDGDNSYSDVGILAQHRYTFYDKWHRLQDNYKLSAGATQRINQSYRYYIIRHRYGHWPQWCQRVLRRFYPV